MIPIHMLLVDDTPEELDLILKEISNRFAQKDIDFKHEVKRNSSDALEHLKVMNPYDIVLIDIVGVQYEELIKGIRALYPYLPISMFSRQAIASEIIKCVDLGAQSFIFKLDLMLGARPIAPSDKSKDEKGWNDVIDKIQRLVEDYRPIKRILEASPVIGWIRKKGDRDSVIEDQISFLKYVKSKSKIATLFPDVLDTGNVGEYVFYEMPLFRMKSLRRLIFGGSDQEKCLVMSSDVLKQVLEITFNHLYTEDRNSDIYAGFVQENYFRKYNSRLNQTRELLVQLKNTEPSLGIQAYEGLLEAKTIKVGEDELQNPTDILNQLETDEALIKSLEPPFLCMIHGDLHFDNILVDDRLPKKMTIKLIDPRGFSHPGYRPGVGDVAYDIGKLLHSAHGYYDFIHAGYLIPDIGSFKYPSNDKVEVLPLKQGEWATVPEKQGGSGAIITSHKRVVQIWAWGLFDALTEYIKAWISNSGYAQEDPNWWLRAKFNEAMHFCTMGKFHLQEDVGRAIAIQIRGIELMNMFYQDYDSGAFNA